jgi:DNA-binding XRE family transcriptional regulator
MSDTITISRAEYQDLIDARDAAIAMRDVATGAMETFSDAEADAYLAAPSALAFWRKRRGMTQAALAAAAGITQPYLGQIERGQRNADVKLYVAFARALGARIDDIAPD